MKTNRTLIVRMTMAEAKADAEKLVHTIPHTRLVRIRNKFQLFNETKMVREFSCHSINHYIGPKCLNQIA